MAAQRAQPSRWLRCRGTRWWKSTASPQSLANRRQESEKELLHALQLEVEPPWFSRQRGSHCRLDLLWFDLFWLDGRRFDIGARETFWRESRCRRKRTGEGLWADRQSLRGTWSYNRD